MRYELELRNLPTAIIMGYFTEIGGRLVAPRRAEGDGWYAELIEMEPARITIMLIPRDLLVIEGEKAQPVYDYIRPRTMRGGG